jgi:uncharacterized membrane protein YjjP (DUF1212 family)
VQDLLDGTTTRDEARQRIAEIDSSDHRRDRWLVTASWGAAGGTRALTHDSGAVASCLAFGVPCDIYLGEVTADRARPPG